VYKTDEIEKEFYSNIESTCEVLNLDQFIRRVQMIREKKTINDISQLQSFLQKVFFFRQKYSVSDDQFLPDLPTTLCCENILNPDLRFIQCRLCKEIYHYDCLNDSSINPHKSLQIKCLKQNCNNTLLLDTLHKQTSSNSTDNNNVNFIGNKRNRQNENNTNEIKIEDKNISINKQMNIENKEEGKYSYHLTEESKKFLDHLAEIVIKKNSMKSHSMTPEEKTRLNIREKICISLVKI
jgi:hypothetical protein